MDHFGESVYIPTNGVNIHAMTFGIIGNPFIILLHGFPEFWYGWRHQISSLVEAGYHVIVPDQRGYNLSDKPKEVAAYSIDLLAKDIIGILDYFQQKKAVIAGHDWGAAVAWYLAMHYPDRLERLIIVNVPHPASMNEALRKPVFSQVKKSWYIFYFQIPFLPERGLKVKNYLYLERSLRDTSRTGTFHETEFKVYRDAWAQPFALSGGINWYRAMLRSALKKGANQYNKEFQIRISVPALVLWGERDAFLEPWLAEWSLKWVDHGILVRFPEATHWILHEYPDKVNHEIIQFLSNPTDD